MTTPSHHPFLRDASPSQRQPDNRNPSRISGNEQDDPSAFARNPRLSTGWISYRTDSPDSSRYLARLPPSLPPGRASRSGAEGSGQRWSQSLELDTPITEGSLPSSLAHHLEAQREEFEAALMEEDRARAQRPPREVDIDRPKSRETRAASRKSYISSKSYSSASSDLHLHAQSHAQLGKAQLVRKASASSHQLFSRGSISSLIHAAAARMSSSTPRGDPMGDQEIETERLNRELGALPWPELPPRSPSTHRGDLSAPTTPRKGVEAADTSSFLLPSPSPSASPFIPAESNRRAYSFLESDPLPSGLPSAIGGGSQPSSRRSSRSSVASTSTHSRSASRSRVKPTLPPPRDVPLSPALSSWSGSGHIHPQDQRFSIFTLGGYTAEGTTERPISGGAWSGMADVNSSMKSRTASGSASGGGGSGMATVRSSREDKRSSQKSSKSIAKSKRSKSARSGKSAKSKRISIGSTRYLVGNWEVEEGTPLTAASGGQQLTWRDVEEKMDLDRLLARSLVLERMLIGGKRVSTQSVKKTLHCRLTASTQRSSLSTSHKAPSRAPSAAPHASSSTSHAPAAYHSSRNRISTSAASFARKSASIRYRLSRKLHRRASQEDTYTEISSQHGSLRPCRSAQRNYPEDPTLMAPSGSGPRGITHAGVTIFPETEPKGPPTPPKPAALMRKLRNADTEMHSYAPSSCLPYRQTSQFNYSLHDQASPRTHMYVPHPSTALRGSYTGAYSHMGDVEKGEAYRQSPHLGHRSPDWRNRRASLASYISNGHWDSKTQKRWIWGVVIGGGLLLILIIGLVGGLIGRRT